MKVNQRMVKPVITISPDASHREAVMLMKKHNIRRLPVVNDRDQLVGIVTESDLLSTSPSPATTLSIYEIYTLLDKLKVSQIMARPVICVAADCNIASAARFMVERKIGCLCVVDGKQLIGIVTETDIFKAFVEALGGGKPGLRIDLSVPDQPGVLALVAQAVADAGGNIVGVTTFDNPDVVQRELSIKEQGGDASRLEGALKGVNGVKNLEIYPSGRDVVIEVG